MFNWGARKSKMRKLERWGFGKIRIFTDVLNIKIQKELTSQLDWTKTFTHWICNEDTENILKATREKGRYLSTSSRLAGLLSIAIMQVGGKAKNTIRTLRLKKQINWWPAKLPSPDDAKMKISSGGLKTCNRPKIATSQQLDTTLNNIWKVLVSNYSHTGG